MSRLKEVQRTIDFMLQDVAKLFKPGTKITFLARQPANDDADFLLTDDDLDDVLKAVERSKLRE